MKHFTPILLAMGMALCTLQGHAQNHRSSKNRAVLDEFRREVRGELEDFRRKAMDEFIEFACNPWKEFEQEAPVPAPKDDPRPPVVMPEDDRDKPIEDRPVVIDDTITAPPAPTPQPQPVEPIREVPVEEPKTVGFTFFGTTAQVRCDVSLAPHLMNLQPDNLEPALREIADDAFDNLIVDCLELRKTLKLSDWAYLQMLRAMSEAAVGQGTNGSTLLMAYVYMLSGYKMRLAADGNRLYMLYASRHQIFDQGCFTVGGERYYGLTTLPEQLGISEAAFPQEKSLSLAVNDRQCFARNETADRTIASKQYADISLTTHVNRNLLDFYSTYPTSIIDDNLMTRWAMYANTPLDDTVEDSVKVSLAAKLQGLSAREAVSRLLNLVQTGLTYEYDDKVWGRDRAFFPEETLYYPYADCEDRAILFTRLVRNLMGLNCILVFYPGHLASAVEFPGNEVAGDYIQLEGKKFVVCDPTYIGAPIGATMPEMDNSTAKVILLSNLR